MLLLLFYHLTHSLLFSIDLETSIEEVIVTDEELLSNKLNDTVMRRRRRNNNNELKKKKLMIYFNSICYYFVVVWIGKCSNKCHLCDERREIFPDGRFCMDSLTILCARPIFLSSANSILRPRNSNGITLLLC